MSRLKDEITAAIYKRAMRVDRVKTFPGTKKIGIVIRTARLEHDTIKYLLDLSDKYQGKFSISTDRTGRQMFSAMIVIEDDPKAAMAPFKGTQDSKPLPSSAPGDPCPECARIYKRFGYDADKKVLSVATLESPIPDMVKFKVSELGGGSEFFLHPECAELLKLIAAA